MQSQTEHLTITQNSRIMLHLPNKAYKPVRCIGALAGDVLVVFRMASKNHKYHKENLIGFNYSLIAYYEKYFSLICVKQEFAMYWTSRAAVMKYGTFKKYSANNLELQIFLQMEKLSITREAAVKEMNLINHEQKNIRNVKSPVKPIQKPEGYQTEMFS